MNVERHINEDFIVEYIRSLYPPKNDLFQEMEELARAEDIPIIEPETAKLLQLLLKLHRPKRILEIGTAIGYSAIVMMDALKGKTNIYTIERDPRMIRYAKDFFARSGYTGFHLLEGDAKDIMPELSMAYDFIFMDAAKAQYQNFFALGSYLLSKGGLIVSDNVLFRGMVASGELVERRKITIVKRLRKYLFDITQREGYSTSVIPIGDGIAVTLKEKE